MEKHLALLGTGYVDMLLLHWPTTMLLEHWEALSALKRSGRARSIGLSNVNEHHVQALLMSNATMRPALVQTELAPVQTDRRLRFNLEVRPPSCLRCVGRLSMGACKLLAPPRPSPPQPCAACFPPYHAPSSLHSCLTNVFGM